MESFKVLISFALLVACAYAAGIPEQAAPKLAPEQQQPLGPMEPPQGAPLEAGPVREKKQALYPYAYGAYPYAAYAYPYNAYPYAAYPYSYSYQYYDDGKYYPGKYDGKYVRAYPYYYY